MLELGVHDIRAGIHMITFSFLQWIKGFCKECNGCRMFCVSDIAKQRQNPTVSKPWRSVWRRNNPFPTWQTVRWQITMVASLGKYTGWSSKKKKKKNSH